MFEPRELHLQTPFTALRAGAEDFENERRAVEHGEFDRAFDVALLRGGERRVEDDDVRLRLAGEFAELLDLAGTEEGRGIGLFTTRFEKAARLQSVGGDQQTKLFGAVRIADAPDGDAHEKGARGLHVARLVDLKNGQLTSPSSAPGRPRR